MELLVLGLLLSEATDKVHQNQEIYSATAILCTLKATHYKDPPKILEGDYEITFSE